ncbi:hypothetical protein [Edaphobacillus lindanitolerans]|uniref:hypothetical protein n=1 Tax=Edaphobacillus lindanitolerans TaxID=550447 RepID=UPI000976F0F4|nr:hypothetical protein [Edaphobacillus lindanitolerans]
MENVVISYFRVESEAFQALSELKKLSEYEDEAVLSQVGVLKKEHGNILLKDSFDTGKVSADDTLIGSIVGGLAGIIAGPLGVLLGVGIGGSVGLLADAADMKREAGLFWSMTLRMKDGDVAIVAVVQEKSEEPLNRIFGKFETVVERYPAAEIQEEIEHAREVQDDLEKQARNKMAEERSAMREKKVDEYKKKMQDDFLKLKERFNG